MMIFCMFPVIRFLFSKIESQNCKVGAEYYCLLLLHIGEHVIIVKKKYN